MLNIDDLMQTDGNGRGVVNILAAGVYEKTVDRQSAYEVLKGRTAARQGNVAKTVGGSGSYANDRALGAGNPGGESAAGGAATNGNTGTATTNAENTNVTGQPEPGFLDRIGGMFGGGSATAGAATAGRRREGIGEAMAKSAARASGSQAGREILRGVLGSILGKRR